MAQDVIPIDELNWITERILPAVVDRAALNRTRNRAVERYSLFMQVRQDYRREEMYRAETIFSVDFSEIFPYLHPTGDPASGRLVQPLEALLARLVFERSSVKMILPPASLAEFLEHIEFLRGKLIRETSHVRRQMTEFHASELAKEARMALATIRGNSADFRQLMGKVMEQWPNLFGLALHGIDPDTSETLKRLKFLCSERLALWPDSIRIDDIDIDDDAFRHSLGFLSSKRPLKPQENYRDSINFAFTSHIDKLAFGSEWEQKTTLRPYLVLLTRGWPLAALGSLAFPYDPIKSEGNLERAGIIRSIDYAVLRVLLEITIPNISQRVDVAIAIVQEYSLFNRILDRIEKDILMRGQRRYDPTTIIKEFGASLIEHHGLSQDRGKLVQDFFESCKKIGFEELVEVLPVRRNKEDSEAEAVNKILQMPIETIEKQAYDIRVTLNEAKDWIDNQIDELRRKSGTNFYSYRQDDYITKFRIVAEKPKEKSLLVLKALPSNDTLAQIELRPHAYAIFCSTIPGGRLSWFCRLSKYLIEQAASRDIPIQLRRITKLYDGLEIMSAAGLTLSKGPLPDDLAVLDDADALWTEAYQKLGGLPRFIRISTSYMDLQCDLFADGVGESRTALISHLALIDVATYFIIRCTKKLVRKEPLEADLSNLLSAKYPLF